MLDDERGPMRLVDAMLRVGPHGDKFDDRSDGLNMAKLAAMEHGLDLGPLTERLPEALPHGRIDLVPEYLQRDLPRLERTDRDVRARGAKAGSPQEGGGGGHPQGLTTELVAGDEEHGARDPPGRIRGLGRLVRARAARAEIYRATEQGTGLERVHRLDLRH